MNLDKENELGNLWPYAEAISAWFDSNCREQSWLLRGQALRFAQAKAANKSLSHEEQRFLSASLVQEAQRLEQAGLMAMQQFDYSQIKALISAMHAGIELKAWIQDGRPPEQYPAASPLLALQTILGNIREKNQLKGHKASFSPDGQHIITVLWDGIARMWDLSGKQIAGFQGHQGSVWSASFSPNGQHVVTASSDKTARVWRFESLEQLLVRGCDWLRDYLQTNPNVQPSDRHICDLLKLPKQN